jgi:RHS repeat-associated protein
LTETNGEKFVTRSRYDLLGLLRGFDRQRTQGATPQFDVAAYEYDGRGAVKKLTDPSLEITTFDYDGFGRLKQRQSPGQTAVSHGFTYDAVGRVDVETIGANRIKHIYDQRGDPTRDEWLGQPQARQLLAERVFDDLGRLLTSRNANPMLSGLPPANRTVAEQTSYDVLGRVRSGSLTVGLQPPHEVISDWSIDPASGAWRRNVSYALGTSQADWSGNYDLALRLGRKQSWLGPASEFAWLGDLYVGRDQEQLGRQSRFRERRTLDNFGLPVSWNYTAIDLDANQQPVNAQDGAAYCGTAWNIAQCARPLLAMEALRDVMGRIVSLKASFGHPVVTGGKVTARKVVQLWRGYEYDPMGRLSELWEHAGVSGVVSTQGLQTHRVTTAEIRGIASTSDQWDYEREAAVGGTVSIRNLSANAERWALPVPRGPGHQIQQARIDAKVRSLQHDAAGQIAQDGSLRYSFDPRGQLAAVLKNGLVVESYFYDAQGRLAGTSHGTATVPDQVFAYDGVQMVAAFNSSNQPVWEAAWGPGLDQLISWRKVAPGSDEQIPLLDSRNSVVAAWRPGTSRMVETADYDPEGRIAVTDANGKSICLERGAGKICPAPGGAPFGYTGAWRSTATGLVYMRNRWYSPELAQFVSQDPVGYAHSFSLYAYVGFEPINRGDPLGLSGTCLAGPSACAEKKKQRMVFRIAGRYDAETGEPLAIPNLAAQQNALAPYQFVQDVVRQIDPTKSTAENQKTIEDALLRNNQTPDEAKRNAREIIATAQAIGKLASGEIARVVMGAAINAFIAASRTGGARPLAPRGPGVSPVRPTRPSGRTVILEHGTTMTRARSIIKNGPDPNFVEPGGGLPAGELTQRHQVVTFPSEMPTHAQPTRPNYSRTNWAQRSSEWRCRKRLRHRPFS